MYVYTDTIIIDILQLLQYITLYYNWIIIIQTTVKGKTKNIT